MTNLLIRLLCLFLIAESGNSSAQTPEMLRTLFESNQLFALRDAVEQSKPPLYRAAVEASLNQIKPAVRDLRRIIQTAPHSHNAFEARDLLSNLYFRNGLYREELSVLEAALVEKPDAADLKNVIPLLKALSQSPDLTVVKRKRFLLQMQIENGTMFLPLKIEEKDAAYLFDTGSSISMMSELEAKRLGLTTKSITTKLCESSGTDIAGFRIAVAKNLVIGSLHLRNIAFGILPDSQEPFVELPQGSRAILGLPVLLAMQTVRWKPKGTFEFSFPSQPRSAAAANMLFHGINPVTQLAVQNQLLNFTIDTGAVNTDLNSTFGKKFPDLLFSGQKESHKITGFGGSNNYDSVLVPSITFQLAGRDLLLKPAHIYTTHTLGGTWDGNLGMDLLNQSSAITLDFQAMRLSLN